MLFLLLTLFPSPAAMAATLINKVDITITTPEIGASPDYSPVLPSGAHYYSNAYNNSTFKNDVMWSDSTTGKPVYVGNFVFEAEHAYNAIIYLTPESGYSFASAPTCTVNGKSVEYVVRSDGQLALYLKYPALIDKVDITFTPPEIGASPDYSPVLPSGAHYYSNAYNNSTFKNDVMWSDSTTGKPVYVGNFVFEAEHAYNAVIYLTPEEGYNFTSAPTCTVNGKSVEYVVRSDGQIVLYLKYPTLSAASWKKDSKGWWYQRSDGTYPKNQWEQIDGIWYHFDASGYMQTGWQKISGKWYYFSGSGAMVTGWQKISGSWYWFDGSGAMATGWQKISGTWYYFSGSGSMVTGWQKIGTKTYFFKSSGAMAANEWCEGYWLNADGTWTYPYKASWKKDNKGWWYGDTSGWYAKNTTITIDSKSYTFDANGYLK